MSNFTHFFNEFKCRSYTGFRTYSSEAKLFNGHAMQITLNLDETLVNEALELTKLSTQEELVSLALRELVRSRRKKNLLDLAGQIQFTEDFDHKDLRETRHAAD